MFRYETFFYYFWVKGFDIRRETQSFLCWPLHLAPISCSTYGAQIRLASASPKSWTSSFGVKYQLSDIPRNSLNSPHASRAWRHPHFVTRFIIPGYCDISEWHVRSVRVHALPPASRLHLTNPCAEPKGSLPN